MFLSHLRRCCYAFLILSVCAVCFSCGGSSPTASVNPPAGNPPAETARLAKPASSGELETWLKAELVKFYQNRDTRNYYTAMGVPVGSAFPPAIAGAAEVKTSSDNSAASYSTTNVQEQGVDEGDLVKTDGNYIYLATGSHFIILNGQPSEQTAIVSDIDLKDPIRELHLSGKEITVVTSSYSVIGQSTAPSFKAGLFLPTTSVTRTYTYNVAVPAKPMLSAKYDFPGSLQGSRRINSTIYLMINYHVDLPNPVYADSYLASGNYSLESYRQASAKALTENLQRISLLTLDKMIPSYTRTLYTNGVAGSATGAPMVSSDDVYIPQTGNGTDITIVIALDGASPSPGLTSSGVISSWCQVYMTTESLYLASSNDWAWIEPIQGVTLPTANPEPKTALHKFALSNGVGKPVYKGSGLVPGWVNNQFSMGEYKGYLRVGTTRGGWWGEGISNRLAILAEKDGTLAETGSINGLAQGEKIYSMRFDKDRGYMVTFRQTDPLFTFDLTDPANPKKAGELKVSGFSTYIHLVGQNNNRLLTVGRSADATGRVTGNKLQLFDVSSLAAPALLGDYDLGDGWSAATYDPHAFLYYEPLGILTIPYYSYGSAKTSYSSGLRVFDIGEKAISQRGVIPAQSVTSGYGSYADTVDRSLVIGTDIFAIARRSVTVAGAAGLDIKKVVGLPEGFNYMVYAY